MNDNDIIEKFWQRDESAIGDTQSKYGTYLKKIAYNILTSEPDSDEAVNDTYLAAWNSIPPHKPAILRSYLSKLTRRISIDRVKYYHAKKRDESEYLLSLDELSECVSDSDTPENELDAKLLGEAIGRFLASLPQKARDGFIRRYFFLDSIADTARSLNISESELKSLMHRTRNKLRNFLEKEGFIK